MRARSIISAGLFVIRLLLSLFALWLTLDWKVHRTRKAFEKQLILQGMAKKDARRISTGFSKLKNEMMSVLKGSVFRSR